MAAGEKYQAALEVKPDYQEALYNWGGLLIEQAKRAGGEEAARLFAAADQKLTAAAKIVPGKTYNLACLAALQGDAARCRRNLENAEKYEAIPPIDEFMAESDFATVMEQGWFQ